MRPAKEIAPVDTIIIDCFYVAYRGFCSTPPLQSKDGTPTNAIHGILGAVRRMVKDLQPKSVIVATEGKTNLRDQMSADYKAGRELPPRFSQQIPLIYKMCKLSGWHLLESDGYEADDVIVTVGRRMRELHLRAAVFSTDKDIISRISDEFGIVGIFKTEKGKSFILEPADYTAKWGVSPALIPEVPLPLRGQRRQCSWHQRGGRKDGRQADPRVRRGRGDICKLGQRQAGQAARAARPTRKPCIAQNEPRIDPTQRKPPNR